MSRGRFAYGIWAVSIGYLNGEQVKTPDRMTKFAPLHRKSSLLYRLAFSGRDMGRTRTGEGEPFQGPVMLGEPLNQINRTQWSSNNMH